MITPVYFAILEVKKVTFISFLECPFSVDCWNTLNISWDTSLKPMDMLIEARTSFGSPIFREIMITACCSIWKIRNAVIFDSEHHSIISWKIRFKEELGFVSIKANHSVKLALDLWKESYS
jgi:hypothetical protein